MSGKPATRRRKAPVKPPVVVLEAQTEQSVVPYDENLLERARTQWQFGDWKSLVKLDRDTLQHHPDRAKLALLAAAGQLQTGETNLARQFIRLAHDWGCSNKLLIQILAAGVHNSIGRAATLAGQQARAFRHFESSIVIGEPSADTRLLAQARIGEQLQQLKLPGLQVRPLEQGLVANGVVSKQDAPIAYLVNINIRIEKSSTVKLGFNPSNKAWLRVQNDVVEYQTEKEAPLYLVSNENGDFNKPPRSPQLPVAADTPYQLSGEITHSGDIRPVVWIFQYGGDKKIDAQAINSKGERFQHSFKTMPDTEFIAIGIRMAGNGRLTLSKTVLGLQERTSKELFEYFEEKIEKVKQAHKNEVESSMKQIEACIRLQNYLGSETILPDMHNWPVSPDFGVLLINLIEQNNYDGVIEFGSGTSTLIMAKALERASRRERRGSSPLLSFDHLDEYAEKTEKLLKQAGLIDYAKIVLAPLAPWRDDNGDEFSYYACDEELHTYRSGLLADALKLLVVIDGPPAATGRHARYPALPRILEAFSGKFVIHFLLDDYLRVDEQEIAARWLDTLNVRKLPHTRTEFNSLEKKACLIEVCTAATGDGE